MSTRIDELERTCKEWAQRKTEQHHYSGWTPSSSYIQCLLEEAYWNGANDAMYSAHVMPYVTPYVYPEAKEVQG